MRQFKYSVDEFFYDSSFYDYDQTFNYVMKYSESYDGFKCPNKIVLSNPVLVSPFKPCDNVIDQKNIIGIFRPRRNEIGVYGSFGFINQELGKRIKNIFDHDSLYTLAPVGHHIFDKDNYSVEYILNGLYIRYKL